MNFFPGRLESTAEYKTVVRASGLELTLPSSETARLASHVGREVVFGVRPEHIRHRSEVREAGPGQTARVQVSVVEPLGSEVYAYLSVGGQELVSRMDAASRPRPNESIDVVFDITRLHVFDKEAELELTS